MPEQPASIAHRHSNAHRVRFILLAPLTILLPEPARWRARRLSALRGSDIISGLIAKENIMEAERLNSLQSLLDDLTTRAADLRRYL